MGGRWVSNLAVRIGLIDLPPPASSLPTIHRWDMVPQLGGRWTVAVSATQDIAAGSELLLSYGALRRCGACDRACALVGSVTSYASLQYQANATTMTSCCTTALSRP